MRPINVILEGGGIQAVAHVGVLQALIENEFDIQKLGAVSAANFAAIAFALGYSPDEIANIMFETDFTKFAGPKLAPRRSSFIGGLIPEAVRQHYFFEYLRKHKGFSDGQVIIDWISDLLARKNFDPHATFAQLPIDLRILAYDYTFDQEIIFSREKTPFAEIVDAIRASTALIPIFRPFQWIDSTGTLHLLTDGGIADGYPIDMFDAERKPGDPSTLGFRLIRETTIGTMRPKQENFAQYIINILSQATENQRRITEHSRDGARTVKISVGAVQAIDFLTIGSDREKKDWLRQQGYTATCEFLKNYAP